MKPSTEQQLWMYETMCLIRHYEDSLAVAYFEGKLPPKIQKGLAFDLGAGPIPGEMHLAAGQESAAVGACAHLEAKDSVWGTHRAHHFAIAKGVDLDRMTAEIFGKVDGTRPRQGRPHALVRHDGQIRLRGDRRRWYPARRGRGPGLQETGHRCSGSRRIRRGRVQPGFVPRGTQHGRAVETPVRFRVPGQQLGNSVNKANSTSVASIADRASSYGMPGVRVTENDPDLIFTAVGEAVARARAGEGPTLLEVKVDRLYGHFQGDPETYRPKGEVESLRRKDSLAAYESRLKAAGSVTEATATEIRGRAKARVEAAIAFARQSDYPPAAEAFQHVFQESAS